MGKGKQFRKKEKEVPPTSTMRADVDPTKAFGEGWEGAYIGRNQAYPLSGSRSLFGKRGGRNSEKSEIPKGNPRSERNVKDFFRRVKRGGKGLSLGKKGG